ncbi:MAG: chromosome segregation protein SMC [Methylobacter sp.]|nr:MAG: chromosome segregation protein SMC [Methylobacter sp.]
MKILKLHFKNINSLAGESLIDFEQAPFTDTGVFAITGPNGSGKSSILDAITLGLYGETFRFDRPARHIMTQHTAESFAHVEFAIAGKRYRASWRVEREDGNPEGDTLPPQAQLKALDDDETVLADTVAKVNTRMAEITGMNFRNFTRSVMLAQGDFAAFLNALDSERLDILEKIVSTDIYAEYKNQVTQAAAQAEVQLTALKQALAQIPLLDAKTREASEHDLVDFQDEYDDLMARHNQYETQSKVLKDTAAVQAQILEHEQGLQQAQANLAKTLASLERIDQAQDVLRFKGDLHDIFEHKHALKEGKAVLQSYQDELKLLQEQIKMAGAMATPAPSGISIGEQIQVIEEVKAQIAQLSFQKQAETGLLQALAIQTHEKTAVLETVNTWLEQHVADQTLLEDFPETGRLKKLRADLIDLNAKQKAHLKWAKTTGATLKSSKASIEQEHKNIADNKLKLQAEEKQLATMAEGNDLAGIDDLRQEQQARVDGFQSLLALAKTHQKLQATGGLFGLFGKPKAAKSEAEISTELDQLELELAREENIRRVLEETVNREHVLKRLTPERQHLVSGKPCPLCGSMQHPYALRPPAVGDSQKALIDQRVKLQVLASKAGKLRQELIAARKTAEKNRETDARLLQIGSEWLSLCNRLNAANPELEIKNIGMIETLLKSETAELKAIVRLAKDYQATQATIENLKQAMVNSEAAIEQLTAEVTRLEADTQSQPEHSIDYQAAIIQCQQEEKALMEKLQAQLQALGEKLPAKGKEDALYDRLNSRRQDCHGYVFRRKSISDELAAIAEKEAASRESISQATAQIEQLAGRLRREEGAGLHLAIIEKQKLIAEKQQGLAQQEQAGKDLQHQLQEKLKDTPFKDEHELAQLLELLDTQPELLQSRAELEQEIDARTVLLEQGREQESALLADIPKDLTPELVVVQQKLTVERIDIVTLELERLDSLLREQARWQAEYDALDIQIQDQQQIARQTQVEAEQISAEDGRALRRRVQANLVEKLLSNTNAVLEKINGRYYLRQKPSEQGLALEVEDTLQGNIRRLPKTLSGGETFIVSLALALGLSELASNGKSVDSLFLDEGFGNLDAENLYTVISTLESLQTHGKTVGVISHVESVQKRFKAQLQVIKKPDGLGELKKAS